MVLYRAHQDLQVIKDRLGQRYVNTVLIQLLFLLHIYLLLPKIEIYPQQN